MGRVIHGNMHHTRKRAARFATYECCLGREMNLSVSIGMALGDWKKAN